MKLLKMFKRKSKGDASIAIMSLFAAVVLMSLFAFFISNIVPVKRNIDAQNIVRKYMLKIEQNGYLTPYNQTSLINDLKSKGITNADLTGTTLTQVNYGDDLYLCVSYKDYVRKITLNNGLIPTFQNEQKTATISKSCTSKKAN